MRKLFCAAVLFLGLLQGTPAQTIPKELWGKWIVRSEIPTTTISCWGEKEAKGLIGTQLEYSVGLFRWQGVVTENPNAETTTLTAAQFHDENSGGSANGSQVTFTQLGINADKATQVRIQHPDANITGATVEIPGDNVLIKDQRTIIFSVCNVYFQAERSTHAAKSLAAQRCGIDDSEPAHRFFAKPDEEHGWSEYRNIKDVPELQLEVGHFASVWEGLDGKGFIRLEEPGEDFAAYTGYCFDKAGRLVALGFELRTAWGWGYREEGPVVNGSLKRQSSQFFDMKNEATITRPEQAGDIPDALKPHLYIQKSRLPFAMLLPK